MDYEELKVKAQQEVEAMREVATEISATDADLLFYKARTHNAWQNREVSEETLRRLYDLAIMPPTSANCEPLRIVFVRSDAAKQRLLPHMMEQNRPKTSTAPVTALLGYDTQFYTRMPQLFPAVPTFGDIFKDNQSLAKEYAFRNGSLQAAYFILAARAVGLDTAPMSGFDPDGVNKEFFDGTDVEVNIVCSLGYGDVSGLYPRGPRLGFAETCTLV